MTVLFFDQLDRRGMAARGARGDGLAELSLLRDSFSEAEAVLENLTQPYPRILATLQRVEV
jgi:hypothetical protein